MDSRRHRMVVAFVLISLATLSCAVGCSGEDRPRTDRAETLTVPRVPPPPMIRLPGVVHGLTNGAVLVVNVNGIRAALITTDGAYTLLSPQPQGTSYVVTLPYQPSGHQCTLTFAAGRLVPGVFPVAINCVLTTQLGNDLEAQETIGQPTSTSGTAFSPPNASTLLQPWGKTYTNDAGVVYVADRGNHRILGFYPAGTLTQKMASFVLGQNNDFTGQMPGLAADSFDAPSSVQGEADTLVVTDTGNHRVLIFNTMPEGQVAADVVVGQSDFVSATPGCSPNALQSPTSAIVVDGQLVIADAANSRVLFYNTIPTANYAAANFVLGQSSLSACTSNRGGTPGANTLSYPQDAWSNGNQMFVTDFGNHRVLGWKYVPIYTGETADIVVGQADMVSAATPGTTSSTLASPMYVTSDGLTLFVSDASSSRILGYKPVPTINGRPASYTLGQATLQANACNQGLAGPTFDTLCGPTGVSYIGGSLAVADTNNNRLQIYNSDPNYQADAVGYFLVTVGPAVGPVNSNVVAAGGQARVTVTAMNVDGTPNPNYVGTVQLQSSDPNASVPLDANIYSTNQGTLTLSSVFYTAGAQNVVAVDTRRTKEAGEAKFLVVAGNANRIVVSAYPNPAYVGQPNDFNIVIYDAYNNVATNYTGTVVITSNDSAATLPSPITFNANSMGRTSAALTFGQAGISYITATDANTSTVTGTEPNILVISNSGTAVTYTFSGYVSPIGAGVQGNVTVTARDANGQLAVGYLGTAHFTSTDANATLPPDTVFNQNSQGVAHLTWTFVTSGNQTVTATDTNTSSITGTSPAVVVQGGNATQLLAFHYPSPVTAGQTANITLRALDAYGNIANTYAGLVGVTVSDGGAVASPNYKFTPSVNGNAQFPVMFETVGTWKIDAQDVNVASLFGEQNQIVVQAGPVKYFLVGGIPNPTTAGSNQNIFVSPRDAYDNLAASYNGSVTISSSDSAAVLPGTITFSNGLQNSSPIISLHTAGTWAVTANDTTTPSLAGMENAIVVNPGPAARIAVSAFPNPTTAGHAGNVTLQAYDAYNNALTKYVGKVHLSSSDAQAVLPADIQFTIANAGVIQVPVTLDTSGYQTINANDTNNLSVSGNQNNILVNPNAAVSYKLSGFPAVINAGQAGNLTVTAYDAYGNIATNYTGSAHFSSTDPNGILPGNTAFVAGDHGVKVVSLTLKTVGTQVLSANDTVTTSIAGMQNTRVVSTSSASYYIVKNFPATVTAGQTANVSIWAYDAYGNLATAYTGTTHLASSDPNALPQSDYTFTAGNAGMANMTLQFKTAGLQVINANDATTPSIAGNEPNIRVNPNVAVALVASSYPNPTNAGAVGNLTITAYDAYGNVATGYTGQVATTSSDANATLPGNYTFTSGDAGVHRVLATLQTAGNQNLYVADTVTSSIAGSQRAILVNGGAATHYSVNGFPSTIAAGAQGNVTVTARDMYNNIVSSYTGTLHLTSTDANAALPANLAYVVGNAGTAQLPVKLTTVGTWSINGNDLATPSISGLEGSIVVTPGAATHYKVTGFPATVTAGQQGNVHIAAYDDYNNLATGYTGTVHLTSTDANAVLPADIALTAGAVDMPVKLLTSGIRAINANDASTPSISGNQNFIVVNPNAAQHLVARTFPSPTTAGAQGNIIVTAYDIYNNIAVGYVGTVHVTSSDANAIKPADFTFTGAYSGVAQLPVTLRTSGNQNITVTDTVTASLTSTQPNIVVNSNATTHYAVSGYPNPAAAGTQGNVTFVALDNYNNIVTGYTGTLHVTSTDVAAVIPYDMAYNAVSAGVMVLPISLATSGNQAIIGTDYDVPAITGMQNFILINPNVANHIGLTGYPSSVVAGSQGNVTVSMLDAYGNVVPTFTGTVNFTSDDTAAVYPSSTAFVGGNQGVRTIVVTFNTNGNHVINANGATNPNVSGRLPVVVVSPNSVTHFQVQNYPTAVTAGQQANVTVYAMDNYNNIVTGYTGTIQVRSTDPNAGLPANYTFTAGNQGNVSLPVTLVTAGTRAISANDTGTPAITGLEGNIVVSPNAAVRFVMTGIPNPSLAGAGNILTVTAFDNYNNVATTFSDVVALTSSDANASLGASTSFTNGVGMFNVTFYTSGTQWLNANDVSNPNLAARQSGIIVNPAAATRLNAAGFPTGPTACQAANIIITAVDNYNNVVPTYTGTVTLTTSDGAAALPAAATFAAGNAGVRPLQVTLKTPGLQTITATDGGGLTGSEQNITVAIGSPNVVIVSAPTTVRPTQTFGATVSVYDNCNNLTVGYTGTINLTSTDTSGTPSSTPVGLTFAASDAGVKSVTGLKLKTVTAARALNANDSTTPGQVNGHATIAVVATNFYADWDYTSATQSAYTYNTSKIDFQSFYAELTPINTQSLDTTSANFTSGTPINTRWDTGVAAMVQGNTNPNVPALIQLGGETFDMVPVANTVVTSSGTYTAEVGTGSPTVRIYSGTWNTLSPFSGNGTYVLDANQVKNTGSSTLYMKLMDFTGQNFVMDANSQLSYWFFPSGPSNPNVTAGNSNYCVAYIKFTDGTFTSSGSYTDTNGYTLSPSGEATHVTMDSWNRVTAQLGAQGLAGKTIDHIGLYWNRTGSTGGFLCWFDDIMVTGVVNNAQTNNSTISSDWTPQYSSIVGYYPFDGNGPIPDNGTIVSAIGANITGHNSDGLGLKYVAARFNTGVFFDGVNDYSVIPTSNFPGSSSISIGGWVKPMALSNTGNPCPRVWILGASTSSFISLLPQCQGTYASQAQGVANMRISGTDYFTNVVQAPNETWSHWMTTYDGTTAKIYLNGSLVSVNTWSAALSGALGGYNYFGADYFSNYFRGIVDEWAVWTTILSPNDVRVIYDRQSAAYAGTLASRIVSSPFQAAGTSSIAWTTTYPSYKPIPSNAVSERTSDYASGGNVLMQGLEYLWHFDEKALGTVYGGDFLDDTGHGNTAFTAGGTVSGGTTVTNANGLFNTAIGLNGNYISTTTMLTNPQNFTLSVWFKTIVNLGGKLIGFGSYQTGSSLSFDRQMWVGPDGKVLAGIYTGTQTMVSSNAAYNDGRWHHAVMTSVPGTMSLYMDGALVGTTSGTPTSYSGYWRIGGDNLFGWSDYNSGYLYGQIDETAIWNRALSASEVLQVYRRGGTRFKYRVRTCANSTCSDNQAWRGPDGTNQSYFSELLNVSGTATQNTWSPNLNLATYTNLGINTNQTYLQYQGIWESDDVNKQCTYNSLSAPCSAEDTNMIFNRVTYDTTSPTITLNANVVSYYTLSSFTSGLGPNGCPGGVTYTLSPDNATYYYYTGSAWASSNGTVAQSSTAAQLSAANLATYSSNYGQGLTYIKAFLTSAGTNPCTLQSVEVSGTQ